MQVNVVKEKVPQKILHDCDLYEGEFGRVIGFRDPRNELAKPKFGTIIFRYKKDQSCIVISSPSCRIGGDFNNDLYIIEKVVLSNVTGKFEKVEEEPSKEFVPFDLNIKVESQKDLNLLWAIFNVPLTTIELYDHQDNGISGDENDYDKIVTLWRPINNQLNTKKETAW